MTIADINTLARFLVGADTVNLTAANLLIFVNTAYERIMGKLYAETGNGKWPPGDINYTAFPTYTVNLVNSQAEYEIDSFGASADERPLVILGAEAVDNNGNSYVLEPITLSEIHKRGIAQSEFHKTDGRPRYYEKREHSIVLYPAPDNGVSVTLTNGLRLFFLRRADVFTSAEVTTGTKEPGFPSPYHDILAYEAAYQYAIANGLSNSGQLGSEVARKERELLAFISRRNPDDKKVIKYRQPFYR